MKRAIAIAYAFLSVLSLWCLLYAIPTYIQSIPEDGIEPGMLPRALCGLILILSVPMFFKTVLTPDAGEPSPLQWRQVISVVRNTAALVAVMPLLHYLGFIPGGIVAVLLLQLSVGQRNLVCLATVSVVMPVATYLLLWIVLRVPLP